MSDTDTGTIDNSAWPMPKFRFKVNFGTEMKTIAFQDVSGMDVENQIIEYRKSDSKVVSAIKMPGMVKYGNVTLKRGIMANDNAFWKWYKDININIIKRQTVTIKLLDENGKVSMTWTLKNAWPTKVTGTDLKSDGNEVAIDTIELAHEGLTISNS